MFYTIEEKKSPVYKEVSSDTPFVNCQYAYNLYVDFGETANSLLLSLLESLYWDDIWRNLIFKGNIITQNSKMRDCSTNHLFNMASKF